MESLELQGFRRQKAYFSTGATRDLEFRKEALEKLLGAVKKHEPAILEALHQDLGKPEYEAYVSEVAYLYEEIRFTSKRFSKWAKPERVGANWLLGPARARIYADPRGVVLILSPWNYPFQLLMAPLVGAIAAGNTAMLKPSELAPATSAVIAKLVKETFDPAFISVYEGGVDVSERLLELPYDYIFFTGGTQVGKLVMTAAAKHLTPVTLELGGKSPCIVHEDADLKITSRRVAWGKFFNAGQTCIAPDYVLVHSNVREAFLQEMKARMHEFFGEDPKKSSDFARIINGRHFDRLTSYLQGKRAFVGGEQDKATKYLAPTILTDATVDDKVMQEEIFGPILPVLEYRTLDEAIRFVNDRPKPLAFYFFSKNRDHQRRVLADVTFGGGCINDTLVHLTTPHLPFGGVGASGMGAYHGKYSFEIFSHRKSVMMKPFFGELPVRYPPYAGKLGLIRRIMR